LLRIAYTVQDFKEAILKQNGLKAQEEVFALNINQLKDYLDNIYGSYHLTADKNIGRRMFEDAYQLDGPNQLDYFAKKNFTNKAAAGDYVVTSVARAKPHGRGGRCDTIAKDVQALKSYGDD